MQAMFTDQEQAFMQRAIELARNGEGKVEPNPMVGCVIVAGGKVVGEGFHPRYGGPHAEIEALSQAQGAARGGTAFVTLEPCCHYGKTPPCVDSLIAAGIAEVVCAIQDPFPKVNGGGFAKLREAGISVRHGLCADEVRELCAPYLKLRTTGRPWIIGKYAMTADGKLAARTGDSQWITSEASRAIAHALRGRVDGILIGRGTAETDNPLLTARPAGHRKASRIVLDSNARLSLNGQLARTACETPVLVVVGPDAAPSSIRALANKGCEMLPFVASSQYERLLNLLDELGKRNMTNVLVEGGSALLGTFHDAQLFDELHIFIAPKIIGGERAPSPIGGGGKAKMADATEFVAPKIQLVGDNIYLSGRVRRRPA